MKRENIFIFLLLSLFFLFILPLNPISGKTTIVYHAKIDREVSTGLTEYLKRSLKLAEENEAEAIIFEIHTPGGAVNAASDIAKLLGNTKLKTIAFINHDALSAGSYIALNMDEIYMVPTGTMGAAAVITQDGNAADQKSQSYWLAAMKSAAEKRQRSDLCHGDGR